jgi:hypothetical protein
MWPSTVVAAAPTVGPTARMLVLREAGVINANVASSPIDPIYQGT